ncbi:CDP-diacylglycerol-serine-O-phosphatidyltransferase (plasmid) [Legionella adelaidensis]|uniref:CDP-diacylglycerol--serine O-phosphatidyltransferase n=1 Tax=Legionella adelaidensis TaxID=45056 RepID=A0A0W0R2R8_9GAMM|nr:CDP-diacylglycerol--serine O-phosphatidyltransferase [Legionella adelaidensis]KTC65379.1 CDP-diacylglycerol-serine-O- phosphatidyltransferase [Legionella adelaidensis]VEH84799.1 CDP-diacylglycerol-serine-O-phosphatidyltransferase [Legionella adelaidensis]
MLKQKESHSGIYLLPNLLTTASLFAAFYSMVASAKGLFEPAVIAIFIGMVADGLDGRIARLTNTQTAFGAEYDSLSDMVTFGVAPSLLLYSWSLDQLGKIGWLVAFMYTAAVALRLARFNVQIDIVDKKYFQGLACPAGAAIVSSFVWFCEQNTWNNYYIISLTTAVLALVIAVLMISNLRYYSFKEIDFKGKVPFLYILIIIVLFVAIAAAPSFVLFFGFLGYALSGPFYAVLSYKRRERNIGNEEDK